MITNKTSHDEAVAAAQRALRGPWGALSVAERAKLLHAVADGFVRRFDDLVAAEVADTGKTIAQARVLVPASPGVKRLQAIVYTQLQRAMLGQISSDAALAEAERQWNAYAVGLFARQTGR